MKTLFEHTSASWVRYSDYEWKEADGQLYLLPTADAKPLPFGTRLLIRAYALRHTAWGQVLLAGAPYAPAAPRFSLKSAVCHAAFEFHTRGPTALS